MGFMIGKFLRLSARFHLHHSLNHVANFRVSAIFPALPNLCPPSLELTWSSFFGDKIDRRRRRISAVDLHLFQVNDSSSFSFASLDHPRALTWKKGHPKCSRENEKGEEGTWDGRIVYLFRDYIKALYYSYFPFPSYNPFHSSLLQTRGRKKNMPKYTASSVST